MRSPHGFFFVAYFCCCLAICDLPAARGAQKTYKQSTIGAELTAAEYVNFVNNRVLPPRFRYSPELNAIVEVKNAGQAGKNEAAAAGDDGGHEGQVLMPRWQYLLTRLKPNVPGGFGSSLGAFPSSLWPLSSSSAADGETAAEGEGDGEGAAGAGGGGISSRVMSGLGSMRDSLSSYWKSTAAQPSEAAADGGNGPGLMASTYGMAKDAATSPMGQEAIKFALSFLPGGGSAVRAYETGTKIAKMAKSAEDVTDKVNI